MRININLMSSLVSCFLCPDNIAPPLQDKIWKDGQVIDCLMENAGLNLVLRQLLFGKLPSQYKVPKFKGFNFLYIYI